jgi:RNA polymerase sigma factor (sigma-70 family)
MPELATRPPARRRATTVPTHEENLDLARRARAGDLDARNELVERNRPLAIRYAAHAALRAGRRGDDADYHQWAMMGLIRAADRFDPEAGFHFSTYARHWLHNSVSLGEEMEPAIAIPVHLQRTRRRLRAARAALAADPRRPPPAAEVARRAGVGPNEARNALRPWPRAIPSSALAAPGGDEPGPLGSGLDPSPGPEERAQLADELARLGRALARLREPYRMALVLRFGLGGGEPATYRDVGEALGITREWARRVERKAMEKLRWEMGPEARGEVGP